MNRVETRFETNEIVELWLRGLGNPKSAGTDTGGVLTIRMGNRTLYQIAAAPPYFEHFFYRHREGCEVTIEWDPSAVAVSFAYRYAPDRVNEEGITLLDFSAPDLRPLSGEALRAAMESDGDRPSLHFSPPVNWMNDPNGLFFADGRHHLFYQFHPNGTDWGPMHWGHATSVDLFHWTHLPVFLHPEQNLARLGATGGAFSGSATLDNHGDLVFYHTERLPAYDLFKGYREIQKRLTATSDVIRPLSSEVVITDRPDGVEHDFRDPKVTYDAASGMYHMVLGASIDGDPAVLHYASVDGLKWNYLPPLYRAPSFYRDNGARCVECPDFFQLGGKWVLVMGFVGFNDPWTKRHNTLYAAIGKFDGLQFAPESPDLQLLDFGTDYYAMQTFAAGDRRLAIAWMFNWEYRKPAGSNYSGEMSLMRELSLTSENKLSMKPTAEFDRLPCRRAISANAAGDFVLDGHTFEINVLGPTDRLELRISSRDGDSALTFENGILSLSIPEDDGSIQYVAKADVLGDLRLVFDRGVIEVFANAGSICGTRRTYLGNRPSHIRETFRAGARVACCTLSLQ